MTTLLYLGFYTWLVGVILLSVLLLGAVKLVGGREEFTLYFNKLQGKNYEVNHIDWALVIAVIFWPSTVAQGFLQRSINKAHRPVDTTNHP